MGGRSRLASRSCRKKRTDRALRRGHVERVCIARRASQALRLRCGVSGTKAGSIARGVPKVLAGYYPGMASGPPGSVVKVQRCRFADFDSGPLSAVIRRRPIARLRHTRVGGCRRDVLPRVRRRRRGGLAARQGVERDAELRSPLGEFRLLPPGFGPHTTVVNGWAAACAPPTCSPRACLSKVLPPSRIHGEVGRSRLADFGRLQALRTLRPCRALRPLNTDSPSLPATIHPPTRSPIHTRFEPPLALEKSQFPRDWAHTGRAPWAPVSGTAQGFSCTVRI